MAEERTAISAPEAISVVAICFGWAIATSFQSLSAGGTRGSGFSDAGFLSLVFVELFCATAALLILHARKYAVRTLFPAPTLSGCGIGLALYVAAALFGVLLAAPFAYGTADQQPIEHLMTHATVSLPVLVTVAVVNGNFEEMFLLGYLARGLAAHGPSIAVAVSLFVRVLYHLYQGPVGAIAVLGYGLVVGVYYIRTRVLFPVIFAHVLGDIVPFFLQGGT